MPRLIDADALMDDVMKRYCKDCDKRKGIKSGRWRIIYEIGDAPCRACSVDDMKDELENAPTIDAVPVVRCSECVHYIKHDKRCGTWNHGGIVPDGFCFLGERRTDENNGRT